MLIKRSDLAAARSKFIQSRSLGALNEAMNRHGREPRTGEITVFLSHKHSERDLLESAIAALESFGCNIYVDWLDQAMPTSASGATATWLKYKIRSNRKFIFLATPGAIDSRWCNWELGHGDAQRYPDNVAVLPITENDGTWKGSEYLQIYPTIQADHAWLAAPSFYYVQFPVDWNQTRLDLSTWLRRS